MLASFRRLSKSTVGSIIMVLFVLAILASFALGDIANVAGGNFGLSGSTLAKVGGQQITDRDMSGAMERRLTEVRGAAVQGHLARGPDIGEVGAERPPQRVQGAVREGKQPSENGQRAEAGDGGDPHHALAVEPIAACQCFHAHPPWHCSMLE